jgi:hypothetical protein
MAGIGRRTVTDQDSRVVFLNHFVENHVDRKWFRRDGTFEWSYCYIWFHGNTAIYVGEGKERRYINSWRNMCRYTDGQQRPVRLDLHSYFVNYWEELEIFCAVHGTTKTAAMAVQSELIHHFGYNRGDSTLFNKRIDYNVWPREDAEDLFNSRKRAIGPLPKPSDNGWCNILKNLPEQLDEGANGAWLRPCPPSRKS